MTGHQEHPGTGVTLMGEATKQASIEAVARACGIDRIRVCSPYDQKGFTEALREALAGLGLAYKEGQPTLNRRFALVTHYPFKGGCEICHLQDNCPKGQGQAESMSIVLPGHEPGKS